MTRIELVNNSTTHFQGWLRANIDVLPPLLHGGTPTANYMVGNKSGLDTWHLDVYTGIGPGERRTVDLTTATPLDFDPHAGFSGKQMWGGIPVTVAGVPLEMVGDPVVNGAAFDGHWRGRVTPMLNVDLWVTWYPHDRSFAVGEIAITASNPAVPDVLAFIPDNMRLVFGDADIVVLGLSWENEVLMGAGDWLADGQSRLLPLVLCWKRHGGNLDMARAIADQKIQIRGIEKLHLAGNPHLPANFDAKAWTEAMLPDVIDALHHWRNSPLDPAMVSGAAGAQGGQSFVAGPTMADPLAVGPFYLAALDGSWPMFHLEADGSQLDWKAHPGLRLYYGKVNVPITSDTLGKNSWPSSGDSHGYAGPEDEHWFDWVLWAGARLKGTPATQWAMRMHAIQFLFRYVTVPPGNWLCPNRGIGWMCFLVAELYRNLADRELAEAVKQRWCDIFTQMIFPLESGASYWSWIGWPRNASIGGTQDGPARAIPWQACVMALGVDWVGEVFEHDGVRCWAFAIAKDILSRTYEKHGTRWRVRDVICQDGSDPGPYFDGYHWFGSPMVVACVLRHEPQHPVAREIWNQLLADNPDYGQSAWLCPGLTP